MVQYRPTYEALWQSLEWLLDTVTATAVQYEEGTSITEYTEMLGSITTQATEQGPTIFFLMDYRHSLHFVSDIDGLHNVVTSPSRKERASRVEACRDERSSEVTSSSAALTAYGQRAFPLSVQ